MFRIDFLLSAGAFMVVAACGGQSADHTTYGYTPHAAYGFTTLGGTSHSRRSRGSYPAYAAPASAPAYDVPAPPTRWSFGQPTYTRLLSRDDDRDTRPARHTARDRDGDGIPDRHRPHEPSKVFSSNDRDRDRNGDGISDRHKPNKLDEAPRSFSVTTPSTSRSLLGPSSIQDSPRYQGPGKSLR